jgi:hypothetical protein
VGGLALELDLGQLHRATLTFPSTCSFEDLALSVSFLISSIYLFRTFSISDLNSCRRSRSSLSMVTSWIGKELLLS